MHQENKITFLLFLFLLFKVYTVVPQEIIAERYQYLSPKPGSINHNPETEITIRFGERIDSKTVKDEFLMVEGEISGKHKGCLSIGDDLLTLTFKPDSVFAYNERIKIRMEKGIKTKTGKILPEVEYWFSVKEKAELDPLPDAENNLLHPINSESNIMRSDKSESLLFEDLLFCKILINKSPASGNLFTTLNGVPGHYIYVFNNHGVPIYVKKFQEQVFNLKPQPKGQLTYYDLNLECYIVLDSLLNPVDTLTMKNGYTPHTHEAVILENGHILMFAYDPQLVDMSKLVEGGNKYATVTGLVIQELDQKKNLLFQWRSWDHINITDSHADLLASAIDYIHGNSLDADTDTTLILSSRNLSEITKINRLNGNIIWRLGGKKNEFSFMNDPRGFSMQHSASILNNGNLILFDNGVGFSPAYSRGIEYKLDEKSFIVELINEFRHIPDFYTHIKGNIQRIFNGNSLVYWGHLPFISEFDQSDNLTFSATFELDLFPDYRVFRSDWEPGLFTLSTDTLNFRQVYLGNIETRSFDIINHSDKAIAITTINNNGDFFITEPLPIEISSGNRRTVGISFSTRKPGHIMDTLNICYETDSTMVNRQLYALAESVLPNGIENPSNSEASIYANPANGFYHLKLSRPESFHIRVLSVFGNIILEDRILESDSFTFNLCNKSDGLYLIELKMTDPDLRKIFKVIKYSK